MASRQSATDRQASILEYIRTYVERHGYPPSVREIGAGVGLRSTASVARYLHALEDQGYISHPPLKRRAWTVDERQSGGPGPTVEVPLVGKITAGVPILASEQIDERYRLPHSLFGGRPDFLLRVVGDSMIEAGIQEEDLVAVESTADARHGDIVIALLGEEATVKRLEKTAGRVRLMPANPRYQPIESPDITIIGRVVGLIRGF